ncbi:acyltransferase [Geobacter sp.]|uniref:acyltransferase family protein n=1 Tax=Geobacter sp. TaxID=46610 RepID=UPI0026017B46|nr:acyltransferase [Geobacter sp.]
MKYSRALDGLRGIAILTVCFFHWGLPWIPGGFFGVDIFFVVSGYLITSILLQELRTTSNINFRDFYLRRILRLFPALCFMLLLYGLLATFVAVNPARHYLDILIVFFYMANWARALDFGHPMEMGHTWSLSIEEQFYLVWPFIMYRSVRKLGPKGLFAVTLFLAAGSTLERVVLLPIASVDRLYNGFDTRMDTLLYGCILAIVLHFRPNWSLPPKLCRILLPAIGWGGIMCSLGLGHVYDPFTYFYGILLVAIFSMALVVSAVSTWAPRTQAVLSSPVFVWFGKRSYGLYLWHYTINMLLKIEHHGIGRTLLSAGIALVMTEVSYRCVERPFLALKRKFGATASADVPAVAHGIAR